jgi:succinate dehydrogenase / fumarate reductase, cytochrome b subunit
MNKYLEGLQTHIGLKFVVALTGAMLVVFVIVHMLGNLQMLSGSRRGQRLRRAAQGDARPAMDRADWDCWPRWLIHIGGITKLTLATAAGRETAYAVKHSRRATLSSRTMALSGMILLAFVIYHLMHFTLGVIHPEHFHALRDPWDATMCYSMTVLGFRQTAVVPFPIWRP